MKVNRSSSSSSKHARTYNAENNNVIHRSMETKPEEKVSVSLFNGFIILFSDLFYIIPQEMLKSQRKETNRTEPNDSV